MMKMDDASRICQTGESTSGVQLVSRADEISDLLQSVQALLIPFIRAADREVDLHVETESKIQDDDNTKSCLVQSLPLAELQNLLPLDLPTVGSGASGLLSALKPLLQYSVNTFAPGFLDKLYAATNAPGLASDLILSALNTNLHVFQVSPALSLIEKHTARALAGLFGLNGPRAGGISVQGGSASNTTSIVVARNTLYPHTKVYGNNHDGHELVLFTSAHGHYSIEKAAQMCGFGSQAVISVPVDPVTGSMSSCALDSAIVSAKAAGKTPFYVNATAGTTVLGSFDPLSEIAAIAHSHGMWFHIDGSWGGSFIFFQKLKSKLTGSEFADSIAINPHKMLAVPITCSFLLAKDLRQFHRANTLPAGYLFHGGDDDPVDSPTCPNGEASSLTATNPAESEDHEEDVWTEPNDLADLTLQCGRRGDSPKLFLSWQYYGSNGYASQVENAHLVASHLASLLAQHPDAILVSEKSPPCLQVCFYFAPNHKMMFGDHDVPDQSSPSESPSTSISSSRLTFLHSHIHKKRENDKGATHNTPSFSSSSSKNLTHRDRLLIGKQNSTVTERITRALVTRGFMVDFAPPLEGQEARGKFFRVVVNFQTRRETVERLVREIMTAGWRVSDQLSSISGGGGAKGEEATVAVAR